MIMKRKQEVERIAEKIRKCTLCRLWKTRNKAVPGEGPSNAKIMFIGQAPGREEDKTGRPFVGRAGKFLNELLENAGMNRKKVFITSVVKCFPPRNRLPTSDEAKTCVETYLKKQILLINPKVVVLLGKVAQKYVPDELLSGRIVVKTIHPAAGMRFPRMRKKIKRDFKLLGKLVEELS